MKIRTAAFLAAMSIALLPACGGNETTETTETGGSKVATPEPPMVDQKDIEVYFEALATSDVDEVEKAVAVAAPESIAFAYAKHQQNLANASLDAGAPADASKFEKIDDGFETCTSMPDGEDYCVTYTEIETDGGQVSNFAVSGRDLKDAIALGNGAEVKIGALGAAKYLSSYVSASGSLFVTFEVKAGERAINVLAGSATYRGSDGRQRTAETGMYPSELGADSTATMFSVFPKAQVGGEMTLEVFGNDFNTTEKVTLKTK